MRVELFFKGSSQLDETIELLQATGVRAVNLPNKGSLNGADLLTAIDRLAQVAPEIDVVPHFSLAYQYARSPDPTFTKLVAFSQHCAAAGVREIRKSSWLRCCPARPRLCVSGW